MPGVAHLFPGQGAQAVGMGRDLYDNFPAARRVFDEADEALGFALSKLCFDGPDTELRRTVNTQPAILVTSIAALRATEEARPEILGGAPSLVAGHSLGEYTALIAAGSLDFADALRLVRERGRLMEYCSELAPGTMAAVLGLDDATVAEIAREAGVEIANINAPGQVSVSGTIEGVAKAEELARARGARRAIRLDVGGAFHSRLMAPAAEGLAGAVAAAPVRDARVPLVTNSTTEIITTAAAIREELLRGLVTPVLWAKTVEVMLAAGITTFVEIGPGRVLTGIVKRMSDGATVVNIENAASLKG
ncbi:MAG: ACP S-malonyltransferase [Chloroflexi bacterium]|nr:ACP S-malonyltransferase [Chloroflexota bacterium]